MVERILVVDDSEIITDTLSSMFSVLTKARVDIAATGVEAINRFSEALECANAYDLVTLDYHMPVLGGADTIEQLRKLENKMAPETRAHIVFVTSDDDPAAKVPMNSSAADGYILKPVNKQDLLDLLDSVNRKIKHI